MSWIKKKKIFFKRRKQCEDKSDKESKTTQVAHEDLNDVDDPTKEIAARAQRKFQLWWLKSYSWLDYHQENNSMKCSSCDYVWLTYEYPVTIFLCYESRKFEHIFFCAAFVILKSTPCLTSHSGNTNFKLERVYYSC